MFSIKEKKFIATEIAKIIKGLNHPEIGDMEPKFKIHIDGKESWSYADIQDNASVTNSEKDINPWNEQTHEEIKKQKPAMDIMSKIFGGDKCTN